MSRIVRVVLRVVILVFSVMVIVTFIHDKGVNFREMIETISNLYFSVFCPLQIFQKQKEEQMEKSSSTPSFSICNIRIQKQMSRSFGKTSSALFRHLPGNFPGTTSKKNVLSTFKRNFTPAKSRKQETFFFGDAERSEAVVERYERTIQFQATTHAGRAISRSQDYQQNTFELCLIHTAKLVRSKPPAS